MNRRFQLDDAAITQALVHDSDLPIGLEQAVHGGILRAVAATPQRRPWFSLPATPQTRLLLMVAVVGLLIAAAAGAIAVSSLMKPRPAPPMEIYHHNGVIVTVFPSLHVAEYPDHDRAIAVDLPYFGNIPGAGRISWSPDGKHLLAWVDGDVRVGDIGSRAVRTLWICNQNCQTGIYPEWSPDGKSIAIGHGSTVTLVSPAGTVVDEFTLAGHKVDAISWAPTADRLVVAVDAPDPERADGNELPQAHGTGSLLIVNLHGELIRDLRAVDGDGAGIWDVDWSPDGQSIAFISAQWRKRCCTNDFSLVTISADGENRRILADAGGCYCAGASPGGVAWSPDGTLIAFGKASIGLYVIRPDGTQPVQVSDSPAFPAWQPVR